jgi:viroplasmin and RNaseH domain-containing protein
MSKPGTKLTVTGKTRESVVTYLENVHDRKFTDAERELAALKEKRFPDEEYQQGYLNAMEGLLLSVRSGDDRDFYNRTNGNGKSSQDYVKEFKEFRKLPIRTQFDQGFFSAWTDIIQYKINTEKD